MSSASVPKNAGKPNLAVNIGGLWMKNPVTVGSGTFGFGPEYAPYLDLNRLGAIVVKGITLLPRAGNATPRLVETPAGVLNSIGLQNPGVDRFITEALPFLADFDLPVIVNIAGDTVQDYTLLAEKLSRTAGVAALEVNISCPNVKKGGLQFGSDPASAAEVTRSVKESTHLPVIVKLSPNVTSIVAVAEKVAEANADALSLINTLLGMAINIRTRRPVLGNILGGLSGPAVKPVALRAVWQVRKAVNLPIIGMGGIISAADAIEFFLAGATAVAIGSANFINPLTTMEVLEGIERYLMDNSFTDIREISGLAHNNI
ncbi:MAG: dihydroorotate dehydrogenase [Desulfotomaculaceae bacterium]|nr:dihydroorotate dehydrogenase [Desulfotomaculaceae bacterium]